MYHHIRYPLKSGKLRLLAGNYKGHSGIQGKYLPLDYYDIFLDAHAFVELNVTGVNKSAMVFTLEGDAIVSGTALKTKTAAKLGEPIAWYGPIVMNTRDELRTAIDELNNGGFIKQEAEYENK